VIKHYTRLRVRSNATIAIHRKVGHLGPICICCYDREATFMIGCQPENGSSPTTPQRNITWQMQGGTKLVDAWLNVDRAPTLDGGTIQGVLDSSGTIPITIFDLPADSRAHVDP
jgi:hypothetical protein